MFPHRKYENQIYLIKIGKKQRIYLKKHNKIWWIWYNVARTPAFSYLVWFLCIFSPTLSMICQEICKHNLTSVCLMKWKECRQQSWNTWVYNQTLTLTNVKVKKWVRWPLCTCFLAVKQDKPTYRTISTKWENTCEYIGLEKIIN